MMNYPWGLRIVLREVMNVPSGTMNLTPEGKEIPTRGINFPAPSDKKLSSRWDKIDTRGYTSLQRV